MLMARRKALRCMLEMVKGAVLLYVLSRKCVAVACTASIVLSFSATKPATPRRFFAFDNDQEIIAATHQVTGLHLLKFGDSRGNAIEAAPPVRA